MQKLLILVAGIVLLAVAITGVLLFTGESSGDGPSEVAAAPAERQQPAVSESAEEVVTPHPGEKDEAAPSKRAEVETEPEPVEEPEEAPPLPTWEPAESRWLDVTVLLPQDAPPDSTLVILALDGPRSFEELYGRDGVVPERQRLGRDTSYRGLVSVAPVDATGHARVAFPPETTTPHVALSGRYCYSTAAQAVDLDRGRIELRAELGAWVTGRLLPPAGETGEWGEVEVRVATDISSLTNFGTTSGQRLDMRGEFEVGSEFEFLAVPLTTSFTLGAESDDFAVVFDEGLMPAPGEHLVHDLQLALGARVTGRVVDETGDPIAGAEVDARTREFYGRAIVQARQVKTDEDGRYELDAVCSGKIWLLIEHEDYVDYKTPSALMLEDGDDYAYPSITLSKGSRLEGVVMFPDGTPAVGAELELQPDFSGNRAGLPMNPIDFAGAGDKCTADQEGEFSFSGLGVGPFRLAAEIENEDEAARTVGTWRGQMGLLAPAEDVEASTQLLLVLDEPLTLTGTVLDLAGEPVPKFEISADLKALQWYLPPAMSKSQEFESEDGHFEFTNLRSGKWTVVATADGYASSKEREIELPTDEEILLELARPASISGVVVDPSGNPVAGATIEPELDMLQMIRRQRGGLEGVATTTSDSSGLFHLEGVPPGDGNIRATKDGWAGSPQFSYEVAENEEITDVELRLRVGGTITGEVVEEDGGPLVGVDVFIQQPTGMKRRTTRTDSEGRFREDHLEPAKWQVMALSTTSEEGEFDMSEMLSSMKLTVVDLADGAEEHVILGAGSENPVVVEGRVMASGEPVEDALVSFVPSAGGGIEKMKLGSTSDDGRYEVKLGEPGDYLVTIQRQLGMGQQNTLEYRRRIPETDRQELDFDLPLGRITGTVYASDGEPAVGARVTLNIEGGAQFGTLFGGKYTETSTDDAGEYDLTYLRPGGYLVAAGGALFGGMFGDGEEADGRIVTRVEVREGQWVRNVDFRLEQPGSVAGVVVDHAGSPVEGAVLFARDENGSLLETFSFVKTDAAGRFEYKGLAPGRFTFAARKDSLSSAENETVRVESGAKSEVRIVMDPGTMLRVTLEDKSGELVPAVISVTDAQGREVNGMRALEDIMETFQNGVGNLEQSVGPLPPGSYSVRALASDGRSTKRSVTLSGQDERKLRLRLK